MEIKAKIVAIIPARYQSTRFEGKPLAKILGKPMIQHVYENIKTSRYLDEVFVATDDKRIFKTVQEFGAKAIMTSSNHPTGTDRVAEAAKSIKADIIVNVQGDEPLVNKEMIKQVVNPLLEDKSVNVTNLITTISNIGDYIDVTVVKAALDKDNFILYLTRSPIPYPKTRQNYVVHKQIGLYALRKDFLLQFVEMPQTNLELVEGVEFLRILENGYKIKGVITDYNALSVDTLSDLIEVEKILKNKKSKNA
ncbi:MAG: 3-deoxy-manno-octulosonate cytidylyltransferase [Candidatus Omnitrophica bacterium]|jgi:3-deoxy-manno-octulosonate cytidylyltransferase (CMP-KDO synthetase)|nr:3-deoxy-manno-octulosonate cytidylyltransferase [Candidatus Omnitrophota bacterium]